MNKKTSKMKYTDQELNEQLEFISNIQDELIQGFRYKQNRSLDYYAIAGLKRKGFEFKTPLEFSDFIKERCKCVDYASVKKRFYSVDGVPFLLHRYKTELITDPTITGDPYTVVANFGSFKFL
ncbi:hypothetical protein FORMB_19130 [Formosa sp. Hel1_33_131]|uniref:hypothetical protein n=1 Tax=Formosa sp. Hel1_33_131 TaxID=1336794 RepID=UPI00084E1698|nr:hypothetical protein [Formosa sp. Hel1_33_131]AOR28943.1 hypothetical protein FORMB_19130 [Formosa sp. Hel1_33_131]